jgi:hypothetical protein
MHVFGADTQTYPNEFDLPSTFPAFSQIFDLHVSGSVSARWSLSEWEEIVGGIMSNDTTDTADDVFGKVWTYFVRDGADANPAHAGVRYAVSGLTYTRIQLLLYDTDDLPSPCPASYGVTCNGWSSYAQDRLVVNASSYQSVSVVLGLGIAHELQHLCFAANNSYGYEGVNESLSTLAEYFLDSWRSPLYDIPYDASVMDIEPCDLPTANLRLPKYLVYRIWMTYLYEVFKGSVGDSTDDLLYRWIRSDAVYYERLTLETLAELLWEDEFDWLGVQTSRIG